MAIATTRAPIPAPKRAPPPCTATAVPTSTGETEAARVAGRAASHQTRAGVRAGRISTTCTRGVLGTLGELREVRLVLVDVGVATLLRLLAQVVEERGVAGQLLDARQPIVGGVQAGLDHAEGERTVREHLPTPGDGLPLEVGQRHHLVAEPHLE